MQKSEITLVIGNGVLRSFGTGTLSRGVVNSLELIFIDKDKNAVDFTDIARWEAVVTQDYLRETLPLLATDESEIIDTNIISLIVPEDSAELSDVIDGRKSIQAFVTIFGRNAVDDIVKAYTFPVILLNMGISYADIAENSLSNLFYSKEQIDKKEKAIYKAIDEIDTSDIETISDISELTDNQGILDAKEDKSNKTASISKTGASGIKYPSESAVVNFVESEINEIPEGLTLSQVKTGLNINEQTGSTKKYVSERNTIEEIPEMPEIPERYTDAEARAAIGIDEQNGSLNKALTEKGVYIEFPAGNGGASIADVKTALHLDEESGLTTNYLSEKNTIESLPAQITVSDVKTALNINEATGLKTRYISEKNTIEDLPAIPTQYTDEDAREAVGIDFVHGNPNNAIMANGGQKALPTQYTDSDAKEAIGIDPLDETGNVLSKNGAWIKPSSGISAKEAALLILALG